MRNCVSLLGWIVVGRDAGRCFASLVGRCRMPKYIRLIQDGFGIDQTFAGKREVDAFLQMPLNGDDHVEVAGDRCCSNSERMKTIVRRDVVAAYLSIVRVDADYRVRFCHLRLHEKLRVNSLWKRYL
jgi:hypothetical protein